MADTPPAANPLESSEAAAANARSLASVFGIYPLLASVVIVGMAVPWGMWLLISEPAPTPYEQAEEALTLLEAGRTRTAYETAMTLLKSHVADPDLGGSLEFVVGIAHFRKAEQSYLQADKQTSGISLPTYELAAQYLEQASLKTIKSELKPEWAYALGTCYFRLKRLYEAREFLELADSLSDLHRAPTLMMLAECAIDRNVLKASLEEINALEEQKQRQLMIGRLQALLTAAGEESELAPQDPLQILLLIAELQRQNGEFAAAQKTLADWPAQKAELEEELSEEVENQLIDRQTVLQAHLLLSEGKQEQARKVLRKLIEQRSGLEKNAALQAHYLIGQAYASEQRYDLGLEHFSQPALARDSEVCFPANLWAGELARLRGLHEEALGYYLRALSLISSVDDFANNWIDLEQARALIQAAWDDWTASDRYEHYRYASDLAENMAPLMSQEYAHELSALVSRKRAEFVQRETDQLGTLADLEQKKLALDHWKKAGQAYARLALSLQTSERYGQYLWETCHLYRRGNDFPNALKMLNLFIETNPRTGLPSALILKSRLLMDLDPYREQDRLAEAIVILRLVIRDYPKDQSIYDAQLLLGQALMEQNQLPEAIQIWRALIMESPLTPEATEWQSAVFALGKALFHHSEELPYASLTPAPMETDAEKALAAQTYYQQVDEAIRWLDEFVRRIPDHPRALEARWLLAQGLRQRMRQPVERLKTAETENIRTELMQEIAHFSQAAIDQFKILENELSRREQQNRLDHTTSQFLRDAYFAPAHIQFELGKYDPLGDAYRKAIDYYSNAAFHFTDSPVVLLAYYRIAECYRQLQAEQEARRQLEQARVILQQLPEPFDTNETNFSKQQWETLLEQAIRLYEIALETSAETDR